MKKKSVLTHITRVIIEIIIVLVFGAIVFRQQDCTKLLHTLGLDIDVTLPDYAVALVLLFGFITIFNLFSGTYRRDSSEEEE